MGADALGGAEDYQSSGSGFPFREFCAVMHYLYNDVLGEGLSLDKVKEFLDDEQNMLFFKSLIYEEVLSCGYGLPPGVVNDVSSYNYGLPLNVVKVDEVRDLLNDEQVRSFFKSFVYIDKVNADKVKVLLDDEQVISLLRSFIHLRYKYKSLDKDIGFGKLADLVMRGEKSLSEIIEDDDFKNILKNKEIISGDPLFNKFKDIFGSKFEYACKSFFFKDPKGLFEQLYDVSLPEEFVVFLYAYSAQDIYALPESMWNDVIRLAVFDSVGVGDSIIMDRIIKIIPNGIRESVGDIVRSGEVGSLEKMITNIIIYDPIEYYLLEKKITNIIYDLSNVVQFLGSCTFHELRQRQREREV